MKAQAQSKITRMINAGFAASACNLNCSYCYVSQAPNNATSRLPKFRYDVQHIGNALSQDRLGGSCLFNICANGETLLPKEMVPLLLELLKHGHYLEVVTNGTLTKRFLEISSFDPEYVSRLIFKFSLHYLELKRRNQLSVFVENVNLMKSLGASFTIEVVAHDELTPFINELKEFCNKEFGALCHLTIARDHFDDMKLLSTMCLEDYHSLWSDFQSDMFDFKMSTFGVKRHEYCYAGEWLLDVNLETGEATQCYCTRFSQNIFEDLQRPIIFLPIGRHCSLPHCVNSHALMTLGLIPEYRCITYLDARNRVSSDGSQWFSEQIQSIYRQKLYENNQKHNLMSKLIIEIQTNLLRGRNLISRHLSKKPDIVT